MKKRLMALVLCLSFVTALLTGFPAEAAEAYDYSVLDCTSWGANYLYVDYMNAAMRYYINKNSSLRTTLNAGNTVVFAFEGGSAQASPKYNDPQKAVRTAALLLVVKLVDGKPKIIFSNDESNTFPDMPTEYSNNCVAGGTDFSTFWCFQYGYGPGTMKDGAYSYTKYYPYKEHYALKIASSGTHSVYINPKSTSTTGYVDRSDVTGLYVHYRLTGVVDTSANQRRYSMGCVNVGQTVDKTNGKDVDSFVAKCSSSGYFVVDRQLYKKEMLEIYSNNGFKKAQNVLDCIMEWSSKCASSVVGLEPTAAALEADKQFATLDENITLSLSAQGAQSLWLYVYDAESGRKVSGPQRIKSSTCIRRFSMTGHFQAKLVATNEAGYCESEMISFYVGIPGDVDGNGTVELRDVSLLFRMLNGRASEDLGALLRGDMDRDGDYSLRDVLSVFLACRE